MDANVTVAIVVAIGGIITAIISGAFALLAIMLRARRAPDEKDDSVPRALFEETRALYEEERRKRERAERQSEQLLLLLERKRS